MDLEIREAVASDATQIAQYNAMLAMETEGTRLAPEVAERGAEAMFADRSKGRYWLAEVDGEVVGQLMLTYEWSDWRNGMVWWIQSVYVHGDFRRRGVFSALYRHVESLARQEPEVCGLRLYVERDNARAQSTYEALGMHTTNYLVMQSMFTEDEQC
jgi:ribosomal protein S18 acetylase RimI-like enzyme